MNLLTLVFVIVLPSGLPYLQFSDTSVIKSSAHKEQLYNGDWWLSAENEERSGFLEGSADCLTWTAHEKGFSAPSNQLSAKITSYYRTHNAEKNALVTEVWRKIEPDIQPAKSPANGENWKNAHWYLNGLWWRQSSQDEQMGFLEGYLWCLRTCVKASPETYSHPTEYYAGKISMYLKTHPNGDDESIASILSRYQDRKLGKSPS